VTDSKPYPGKRCERHYQRCRPRVARNQPDKRARESARLQLAIELIAIHALNVEGEVERIEQRFDRGVQRAKPLGVGDARVRLRRRSVGSPSSHGMQVWSRQEAPSVADFRDPPADGCVTSSATSRSWREGLPAASDFVELLRAHTSRPYYLLA